MEISSEYWRCVTTGCSVDARISGDPSEHASGNGSIMRLAPVPIRYCYMFPDGIGDLVEKAVESSLPTHASPQCLSACVYMTTVLCGLINGRPRIEIYGATEPAATYYIIITYHDIAHGLCATRRGSSTNSISPFKFGFMWTDPVES